MTEWEAKYRCVVSLVGTEHVEAAELLVKSAIQMSAASNQPLHEVLSGMFYVAHKLKAVAEAAKGE